jgi:uncharacterized lipoprotein YmbA
MIAPLLATARRALGLLLARSRLPRAVLPVLAVALLGACASAPTRVLIALPPAAAPEQAPRGDKASASAAVLLVRRLVIPEYMASPKPRYWSATATLAEWPDAYWAERIEIGMAREFVSALRRRLPGWTVCDATCGDLVPDLTLKIELLRLDTWRQDQSLAATARAELSGHRITASLWPTLPGGRTFTMPLPADSAQGQAQAMSQLLGAIADASVAAIDEAASAPGVGSGAPGLR